MFSEQEKAIFDYFDGSEAGTVVYGDPLRIQRRLAMATKGQLNALIEDWNSPEPIQKAIATEKLVPAIIEAFELTVYDKKTARGCNEATCLEVLANFLDFMDQKKTTIEPSLTSPQATAPAPGTVAPMRNSSGYGPTLIESISKPPTRQPKALQPQ